MPQLDFRTNPPLDVYVLADASLFIAAFVPTDPKHGVARAFLAHAANEFLSGRSQLFATDLAVEEAAHFIIKAGLRLDVLRNRYPQARQQWQQNVGAGRQFTWHDLYKVLPAAAAAHVPEVTRFMADIRAIPVQIIEPDMLGTPDPPLVDRMRDCMLKYELLAADAYHIAVAGVVNATMVATLDYDWLRADPDFTVLTDR